MKAIPLCKPQRNIAKFHYFLRKGRRTQQRAGIGRLSPTDYSGLIAPHGNPLVKPLFSNQTHLFACKPVTSALDCLANRAVPQEIYPPDLRLDVIAQIASRAIDFNSCLAKQMALLRTISGSGIFPPSGMIGF